jgi:itaconate CoA-transferase
VVYLGLQNEREWARFCTDVLEQPGLTGDPRFGSNALRVEHHDELEKIIVRAFAGKTAQQVVERLESAQIANARMRTVDEFLEHPQLAARDKWRDVDSPAGPLRALVPPFGFDDAEPRMGKIPAVGEHTDRILTELGFDTDTIASWRRAGII